MKKYNNKYRVIMEFDEKGELLTLPNGNIDTTNAFIYCRSGNITISRYDKNSLRVDVWNATYNRVKKEIKDSGVKIIRDERLEGESWFIVKEDKHIHKMFRELNAKRNKGIGIKNIKQNYPYWLRHCMKVSSNNSELYKKRLKNFIKERRK